MRIFIISMLFLALAFNAWAEDKIFLYGDYYQGMSFEDFSRTGPAQCDDYPYGAKICKRQKVTFAASEWTQFFEFDKNGLACVAFGQPLSLSAFDTAMAWAQDEKYTPVNAEAGRESVNFTLFYDKNQRSEFKKEAERFNRNLPYANNFNAYLVKQSLLDGHGAMDKLPADAVMLVLAASKSQGLFFVCFELAKNFTIIP